MLNKIIPILMVMAMVAGCGRVSAPKPPEGSVYEYPYAVSQEDK